MPSSLANISISVSQIKIVSSFQELVSTPFKGDINAICWARSLKGDYAEIVNKLVLTNDITIITEDDLINLELSEEGEVARNILLQDFSLLKENGSAPSLNVIKQYEKDEEFDFISTDVYSYHVDRSPVASDTILCTYYGDASDIIPNEQAIQMILKPDVILKLKNIYNGEEEYFEQFLIDNYFDLHYEALPGTKPINLGIGNLWRLAIDYPDCPVLPCIHRAPLESSGLSRLLMIC